LGMVNWKYFLKTTALTAIHAHICLWNVFGHLPKKY
jgi:nitric oxide reductase large subunit